MTDSVVKSLYAPKRTVKLGEGPEATSDATLDKNRQEALDRERLRYEAGDKTAILEAVSCCAAWRLPFPVWLAAAFNDAYAARWRATSVLKSWDEVFGSPWPKGTKPGEIQRQRNTLWAYVRVKERREEEIAGGRPVTPINILFESIGQEARPPVSAAVVSRWFYAAAKLPIVSNSPIPGLTSQQTAK